MRRILFAILAVVVVGCSTPNPHPGATEATYEKVQAGITRQQVYELLGPPKSVQPRGNVEHCQTATWGIPHNCHGWGYWKVEFAGDTVSGVSTCRATVSASISHLKD